MQVTKMKQQIVVLNLSKNYHFIHKILATSASISFCKSAGIALSQLHRQESFKAKEAKSRATTFAFLLNHRNIYELNKTLHLEILNSKVFFIRAQNIIVYAHYDDGANSE